MADLDDLDALAPEVDTDVALAAFRSRRQVRPRPKWPVLAAAATLALAAIVGGAIVATEDRDPVMTGPASQSDLPGKEESAIAFEVLVVTESAEQIGTIRSATTAAEYGAFLAEVGVDSPGPSVDFSAQVVIGVTIPDAGCVELGFFDRLANEITPVFHYESCESRPSQTSTFVIAVERRSLPPNPVVHLPPNPTFGLEEKFFDVTNGVPVSDGAVCADIERFAKQLVDVGITYDYTASQSPVEVFERSDLVFLGRLTGGFTDRAGSSVGYEVEIDTLYKGPAEANLTPLQTIYVEIGAVEPAAFEAAITRGIPVVVFAEYLYENLVRPTTADEGFVTGCPGGPLLGFTGFQGEWAEITDLDDLAARLDEVRAEG